MFNCNIKNKPSLRGLILFLAAVATLLIHSGKIPLFYRVGYLSSEVFILALLNLFAFYALFIKKPAGVAFNRLHPILFLLFIFVALTNPGHWFGIAMMMLFFLLLLLLPQFFTERDIAGLLAASAVVAALLSLFEYRCFKLGVYSQFPILGWLTGFKDSIGHFGVYGQINLLACLMLMGIFFYWQLLAVSGKQSWLSLVPLTLQSMVLFLSRSRSGLLALGISLLLLFYLLYKKQLLKTYSKLFRCGLFALVVGYLLATLLGATSFDKAIQSSQYTAGDPSSFGRVNLWASALAIGYDHPFVGVGIEGFKKVLGDYARPIADKLQLGYDTILQTEWAHNEFLQLFAEHGVIFSLFLVFFILTLIRFSWQTVAEQNLFMLPALVGFLVFMGFGHPLRYPALAFCLIACLSLLIERTPVCCVLKYSYFKPCLLGALLFVNFVFVSHIYASYQLNQFIQQYNSRAELSLDAFKQAEKEGLTWALDHSAYSWRFKHEMYARLTKQTFAARDKKFAAYLLPEVLAYKQQNSFASIAYLAAELSYVQRDYQQALQFAEEAFQKKPDLDLYSNLVHMCHVMLISRSNHRSVVAMTGEKMFQKMKDADMIQPSQLDVLGVAR